MEKEDEPYCGEPDHLQDFFKVLIVGHSSVREVEDGVANARQPVTTTRDRIVCVAKLRKREELLDKVKISLGGRTVMPAKAGTPDNPNDLVPVFLSVITPVSDASRTGELRCVGLRAWFGSFSVTGFSSGDLVSMDFRIGSLELILVLT